MSGPISRATISITSRVISAGFGLLCPALRPESRARHPAAQGVPGKWAIIPEAEDKTLREIIAQGYRVMYRLETDRVLILAVMHGSRDLAEQEKKPWEEERQVG